MRLMRAWAVPLRLRGTRIGSGSYVSPRAALQEHARIVIGERTLVGRHVELVPQGGSITIGSDCSLNNYVVMYGAGGITVHDGCRIATGVTIIAFNHGFDDVKRPIRNQPITARGVVVESDVWIGARSILLDGVAVGRGSVVGAGSVVTRDIPEYAIVAGNPARVVRHRGSPPGRTAAATGASPRLRP
ncbi:acyltransferase [Streptomyces cavernae]|uniref:acyltransferase n=1 Tax=Streptomyces cavernae TaxID=2259034 RepID=UPI000FEC1F13|nr:acyltransferase [Streptomyces cavernae]